MLKIPLECSESNNPKILMTEDNNWFNRLSTLWSVQNIEDPKAALRSLLAQIREQKQLNEETTNMIDALLDINKKQVRDVMIPRGQIVLIEENWCFEKALEVITESGHSRYPVVDEEHRQLRGILISKDLLPLLVHADAKREFLPLVRAATIVPESRALDAMLRDFKTNRNHMALVMDEYGAFSGLVTIEDVIEVIVGEIDDEHDEIEDLQIVANADGSYLVKALTSITDFNEYFHCQLSDEHAETIGGFVLEQCGRLPVTGEKISFDGWEVLVLKANQKRLLILQFFPVN